MVLIGFILFVFIIIYESTRKNYNNLYKDEIKDKENNKKENKNFDSILLVVGAVLVILASIIFLATSWDSIPNPFKTVVLIVLQLIFLLTSSFFSKKQGLEQSSKAFKYIGFAFIPIILLSLSCFSLVGDYLSIDGDGFLIYFGFSFIVTDIIYKVCGNLKKDTFLKKYSTLAELIALFFISSFFTEDYNIILFVLSLYTLLVYFLLQGNYLDKEIHGSFIPLITYLIFGLIALITISENQIISCINTFCYTIYFFALGIKQENHNSKKNFIILSLLSYLSTLCIINNFTKINAYFIYEIALIPLMLYTKLFKEQHTKNVLSTIISIISVAILSYVIETPTKDIYYLISFIATFVVSLLTYIVTKFKYFKYQTYILFAAVFMAICYITDAYNLIEYIPLLAIMLVWGLEFIFEKLKDSFSDKFIISVITIESLVFFNTYMVLVPLVLMIILVITKKEKEIYLLVPMLCSISSLFIEESNVNTIICFALILIFTFLSIYRKKMNIYSVMSLILIIISNSLFEYNRIIFFAILFIWGITHTILNSNNKWFILISIVSGYLLYATILNELSQPFISIYILGLYISLITFLKYVIGKDNTDYKFFLYFGFIAISLLSVTALMNEVDGLINILVVFLFVIMFYIKKEKSMFHISLVIFILEIIYLTIEYWTLIPWYIYILIIGLILIVIATVDEKKNLKKENKTDDKK